MRYLELIETAIKPQGEQTDIPFNYREVLQGLVRAKAEGMDIAEMKTRLKILEKLESSSRWLALEDTQYELVRSLVKDNKWVIVAPEIVTFDDAINHAAETEPAAALTGTLHAIAMHD